jgi:hypothetical protein
MVQEGGRMLITDLVKRIQSYIERIDRFIQQLRAEIRFYLAFSIALFLTGLCITALCFVIPTAWLAKVPDWAKLGPAFVSMAVTAVPITQRQTTLQRIQKWDFLRLRCEKCDDLDVDGLRKLEADVMKAFEVT